MKKEYGKINAQKKVNTVAFQQYQRAYAEYNSLPYGYKPARLRSCSATVYETHNYYILRSYNTVVACIDKSTGICYDVLRHVFGFTSTSCQHINKFISDYFGDCWRSGATVYTFREVEG